jgi:flagellar biogenesis protein FliO
MIGDRKNSIPGGLAGWLLEKWRGSKRSEPRMALLERITLAPRQTLALVEVEGQRLLVATSPEGAPAFHSLAPRINSIRRNGHAAGNLRRRSW